MIFHHSSQPPEGPLSEFLLQHLPLLEIRYALSQPETNELSRYLQQAYDTPTLPNLLDCFEAIRDYRRALLN